MNPNYDVVIIGAGAAGLMCAAEAGKRGKSVLLIDHAKKIGEKIRISGGGRCNFTNSNTSPANFISANPRFCISALKQFTQHDFIARVNAVDIAFHEKTLGQLFCDGSALQIITMLLDDIDKAGVTLARATIVDRVSRLEDQTWQLDTSGGSINTASLVIASGGKSIPKIGATGFGFEIARQFDVNVLPIRAGLVPLTFDGAILEMTENLSGVSLDVDVTCRKKTFSEAMLFTHRGLSGPAILQISSYWEEGEDIVIDCLPGKDAFEILKEARDQHPKRILANHLGFMVPKRLASVIIPELKLFGTLADQSDKKLRKLADRLQRWRIRPKGTEGYRTAEVTLGGVDTKQLSSKTMEVKTLPGLYFIGEVVDVTGYLGGYNFQWAWSSGFAAGQAV